MNKKLALAAAIAIGCGPLPVLAGTSADINASGSAAAFCDISNTGGAISMSLSAGKDKLAGEGAYSFTANGDSTVSLSQLNASAPSEAAGFTPSVSLANLVTNTSSSAPAVSGTQAGVSKKTGVITSEILQNNSNGLISAGAYSIATVATCTAL